MDILLMSDTHGELEETLRIQDLHDQVKERIHLGDVGFPLQNLHHFHIVRGNHDHEVVLPYEWITKIEERTILCIHGNIFDDETVQEVLALESDNDLDIMEVCMHTLYHKLAAHAKSKSCNTLFFGHTHHQYFGEVDDVILVNPGSVFLGTPHSGYAIVNIEKEHVNVTFHKSKGI